jgi:hypothetical protein
MDTLDRGDIDRTRELLPGLVEAAARLRRTPASLNN